MPLFYQQNINDATSLAVWHITEEEVFFLKKVHLQIEIAHPHKRLQHLAGRYLLQFLAPGFPIEQIEISKSKKPLLINKTFNFSISHCGNFAAAIISKNQMVGIDVELVTPKIEKVKHKFLKEIELGLLNNFTLDEQEINLLTLFWSSKEAIYKWYGKGALSFRRNMTIEKISLENKRGFLNVSFQKQKKIPLKIDFIFFDSLCLAWVIK